MKVEIRELFSTDTGSTALDEYSPGDPANVGILVRSVLGVSEEPGEDSFDVMVCTPNWLADHLHHHPERHIFGRHHLIVQRWDYVELRKIITGLIERLDGQDWHEFGTRLDGYMHWEFGTPW